MEKNTVISMTSSSGDRCGDEAFIYRNIGTYAEVKRDIDFILRSADNHSDIRPKVTWSSFRSKGGKMVEKCAIEWSFGDVRMVDVIWVRRGYR